ncbi:TFIIH/NER complex subunit [Trapelia coarctata]|nr:TFIIH/NER complex subunit [Trapelia coarctata]
MAPTRGATIGDADGKLYLQLYSLQLRPQASDLTADESGLADVCPVCKSSRYLNPNMRFKINPECYHRMCESCIDRIFSQGPAPCPVAGCGRTLRKGRFKTQTFEDVKIERECDIRAEISKVFNRREEEFTGLRAYNDYLEKVEDIAFNLINKIDVAATQAKLAAYKAENSTSIARNSVLANQEHVSFEEQEAAQRELSRLNREAAFKEMEDEKREREAGRKEMINRIATGSGDPDEIARQSQKVVLKQSTARRTAAEKARQQQHAQDTKQVKSKEVLGSTIGNGAADSSFTFAGLKPVVMAEPEKPYDPLGGVRMEPQYYTLQSYYEHSWLDNARNDPQITAGGYDVTEYYTRALLESNAGLCCFIADEKAVTLDLDDEAVGTAGAALAAAEKGGIEMDVDP